MSRDEKIFLISVAEFSLHQAELQASSTKMFLLWLDGLQSRIHLHRRLDALPDCEEKQKIADELAAKENSLTSEISALR
jgi:hypothetical protein